eukprot:jgi/Mesvir1/10906/Mv22756-RA.1
MRGGPGNDVLVCEGPHDVGEMDGGDGDDILLPCSDNGIITGGRGRNIIIGSNLCMGVNRTGEDISGCHPDQVCFFQSNGTRPEPLQPGDYCRHDWCNLLAAEAYDVLTLPTCPAVILCKYSVGFNLSCATSARKPLSNDNFRAVLANYLALPPCSVEPRLTYDSYDRFTLNFSLHLDNATETTAVETLLAGPSLNVILGELFASASANARVVASMTGACDAPSVTSDPHIATVSGDKFDFGGVPGGSYCMLSSTPVHVNARMTGPVTPSGAAAPSGKTWMDQVAILYKSDVIVVSAESNGTSVPFALSFGTVTINGVRSYL